MLEKYTSLIDGLNEIKAASDGVLRALDKDIQEAQRNKQYDVAAAYTNFKNELISLSIKLGAVSQPLKNHFENYIDVETKNKMRAALKDEKFKVARRVLLSPIMGPKGLNMFFKSEKENKKIFEDLYKPCENIAKRMEKVIEDYRMLPNKKRNYRDVISVFRRRCDERRDYKEEIDAFQKCMVKVGI